MKHCNLVTGCNHGYFMVRGEVGSSEGNKWSLTAIYTATSILYSYTATSAQNIEITKLWLSWKHVESTWAFKNAHLIIPNAIINPQIRIRILEGNTNFSSNKSFWVSHLAYQLKIGHSGLVRSWSAGDSDEGSMQVCSVGHMDLVYPGDVQAIIRLFVFLGIGFLSSCSFEGSLYAPIHVTPSGGSTHLGSTYTSRYSVIYSFSVWNWHHV